MTELKNLSLQKLRELAKEHLGKRYSRLKTKDQLVAALVSLVPSLRSAVSGADVARGEEGEAKTIPTVPSKVATRVEALLSRTAIRVSRMLTRSTDGKDASDQLPRGEAKRVSPLRGSAVAAEPSPPPVSGAKPEGTEGRVAVVAGEHPAEPLVEGFFVARVAGEREARRHHLTEEQALWVQEASGRATFEEHLGEIPSSYEDDAAVLLARDPSTLYFFWDFAPGTRREAERGLVRPRAVLRLFDENGLVREVDFAFESRSFYFHGLRPGRRYQVEACLVGADGRVNRVGRASNWMALPPLGVSDDLSVRFFRIPWDLPLLRVRQLIAAGGHGVAVSGAPAHVSLEEFVRAASSRGLWAFSSASDRRWAAPLSGRPSEAP